MKKESKRRNSRKIVASGLRQRLSKLEAEHKKLVEDHRINLSLTASQIEIHEAKLEEVNLALNLIEEGVSS